MFWGCPPARAGPHLTPKRPTDPVHPLPRRRTVEQRIPSAQEAWKLYTAGSVGSQTLLGLPWLARLLKDPRLTGQFARWPFETGFPPAPLNPLRKKTPGVFFSASLIVAEIYPRLVESSADPRPTTNLPRDAVQVTTLSQALADQARRGTLAPWFACPVNLDPADTAAAVAEEGWILGAHLAQPPPAPC